MARQGVGSVLDALEGVHFPAEKRTLIAERGDREVEFAPGKRETLRVMLLRTDADSFASAEEVVSFLEQAID